MRLTALRLADRHGRALPVCGGVAVLRRTVVGARDRLRRSDVARLYGAESETEDRLRRSDAAYGGVAYAVR